MFERIGRGWGIAKVTWAVLKLHPKLLLFPVFSGVAFLALITALMGQSQANRLVYLASVTLFGLGLFIFVMAAEPYLRNGLMRQQLGRHGELNHEPCDLFLYLKRQ